METYPPRATSRVHAAVPEVAQFWPTSRPAAVERFPRRICSCRDRLGGLGPIRIRGPPRRPRSRGGVRFSGRTEPFPGTAERTPSGPDGIIAQRVGRNAVGRAVRGLSDHVAFATDDASSVVASGRTDSDEGMR